MVSVIGTIIVGFIVGLLARALMPGDDRSGYILTTLLGIGGALLGKYIGQFLGFYNETDAAGFLMSLVGALVLLFIYNNTLRRRA